MKRLLAVLLVVCCILSGCGATAEETTTAPVETTTEAPTTQPTAEPTEPPTTVPPETTEPAPVDTNPLTGEALDAVSDVRPLAIMINNTAKATPQAGISQADILYEILAEGSITRFMAIFTDLSDVGEIGPVRSVRPYFLRVAQSYDAILSSAGGSDEAMGLVRDIGYPHVNGIGNSGSYFYRDAWRKANRGLEHSLMTTGAKLLAAVDARGYRDTEKEGREYGLSFDDAAIPTGEAAAKITVRFLNKSTTMNYDAEQKVYAMYQHGETAVDCNGDIPLTFRNVVILEASTKTKDSQGRLSVQTTGEGKGYLCRDGVIIPIRWSRADNKSPYVYTDAEGNPVSFGVGKSYIAIVPKLSKISFSA